jgi:multiple sugar transport system permease protein
MKRHRTRLERRETLEAWAFLLPNLLGFLVFTLFPVFASLALSFANWDILGTIRFAGMANFVRAATDPLFWRVMINTAYFTFAVVPLQMILSFAVSLLLNQKIGGLSAYRTVYFLPEVCSTIAIAAVWVWIYEPDYGLMNEILRLFGIKGPQWLRSTTWAMPAVIISQVWRGLGFNIVVILAGLQGIPQTYYEAAQMDGASSWDRIRRITLPLMTPTIFFLVVMGVIRSFQVFNSIYVMTAGGPGDATRTLVYFIYQAAYVWLELGYGSSLAWVLAFCLFAVTLVQWRFQKTWVTYD